MVETEKERDELQIRFSTLGDWHSQTIVYGDIWKMTMDQTGNYTAEMFMDMGASLNAVKTFRLNLRPEDIYSKPLPIAKIQGLEMPLRSLS